MNAATAAWRASAAYWYVLHLDPPSLAWEYLRRNVDYQADWHARRRDRIRAAKRWGLLLLEDPGLDARDAQPLWHARTEVNPQTTTCRVSADDDDAPNVWAVAGRKRLLLDDRGLLFTRYGTLSARVDGVSPRAIVHMRALQALDGSLAGASHREIAIALFGDDYVTPGWFSDSPLRARTRRYLRRAQAYSSGGYRALAVQVGHPTDLSKLSLPSSSQPDDTHGKHRGRAKRVCSAMEPPAMATPPIIHVPPRYLTADEAAAFLRLSPRTLEKHRSVGGGPPYRKFGRRVCYTLPELEAWAEARRFEMTSDPDYPALPSP